MAKYAIIGIGKLKAAGNISGVIGHMTRQRKTENSNGRPNDVLIKPPTAPEVMQEIALYMPRKNAVLAYDVLLTASPEWFTDKTEEQIKEWEQKSLDWACEKFGRDNVKGAICHRDETTPHLQLLIIPEHCGKLNARYYTGGREKMRQLWTEYGQAMKPLGLERGREYSPAKHQDIKAYYAAVNRGAKLAAVREITPEQLPAPELLDRVSPRQYAADLINRVTSFIRKENGALRSALAAEQNQREEMAQQMIRDRETMLALKENPEAFQKLREALAAEAEARAGIQARFSELVQAIGEYFRANIDRNSTLRHPDRLGKLQDFPELQKAIRLSLIQDKKPRHSMVKERG